MNNRPLITEIFSLLAVSLSVFLAVLLLPAAGMEVSAAAKNVPVSKSYTENMTYQMEVSLNAGGSFFDGETEIQGGSESVIYSLPLGDETPNYKEFEIRPAAGYRLTGLSYTEPDIDPDQSISLMDQIKDGKISLMVKSTRMVLTATFEKIGGGSGEGSGGGTGGSGGSGTSGGNTGSGSGSTGSTGTNGSSGKGSSGKGGRKQTGMSSATGTASTGRTGTGDQSSAEWYLLLLLTAAAAMAVLAAKKQKEVYKESE